MSEKALLEFEKGSHTLPNLLRIYAWKEKNVTFAGYKRDHLLIGKTTFILKTKKEDASKVLKRVIQAVKKDVAALKKAIK